MGLVDKIKELVNEWKPLSLQIFYHGKEVNGRLAFPFNPDKETVLLAHGYAARGRSLEYVAQRLHDDGYNAVPLYYPFWEDLKEIEYGIAQMIQEYHLSSTFPRKIHLVAHSMGGLVSCGASKIVPDSITSATFLGTPFGGTTKAKVLISRNAEQLLPGSRYLQELLENGLPKEISYSIIQGTHDRIVPQERGRLLVDQQNIHHYHLKTGHLGLIGPKGYPLIRQIIKQHC